MPYRAAEFAGKGSGLRAWGQKQRLLVAGAVTALLMLALWLALPGLLAASWTQQLRALGYPQAALAIDDLGWTHAVGAFSLGGEAGADGFEADFTPMGLWQGRLSRLTVRGLRLEHPLSLTSPGLPADLPLAGPVFFKDARLSLALPGGVGTLPLTLDASFTPVPDGWHGEAKGILALGRTGVPAQFTADWRQGALTAAGFTLDPTQGGPRLRGQGQARRLADGHWTGTLDVAATGLPDGLPDLMVKWENGTGVVLLDWNRVARFTALLDSNVHGKRRLNARLNVTEPAQFAARLGRPDPGLIGGRVDLNLLADGFTLEDWPRTWPDLAIRLDASGIGLGKGPRDNALSLGAVARRIDGTWWLSPLADQPGRLSLPTLGLEARGLQLTGVVSLPLDLDLDLRAASLRLPWLAPSALTAKLRGDPGSDLRVEWKATNVDNSVNLSGFVDVDAGGGRLLANLSPVYLQPGDAARLFPGAPLPTGLSGTVAGRLTAGWTQNHADGAADLMLENVGWSMQGLNVAGVNGVLRFDRLSPLSMPSQTVAIGLFDPGIALTGGTVGLSMGGDGVMRLVPTPFTWAGQSVSLTPTSFRIGNSYVDLRLDVPATPLPDVLTALGVDGVVSDGTVIGSIPIRISATGARAGDGALRTVGPGRLALREGAALSWLAPERNDSLALVARALSDYRFRALALDFKDGERRLSLSGANPSLYGGYDMPMNLRLSPAPASTTVPAIPAEISAAMAAFKARRD
ncbi:hypothetical protein CHU95_11695 [Niveispirillum lacus]|uniref:Uncharacterized protein n=1 Tax=Niveispirillum lacus TaxID=1981099 RepID=A0A255YY66_9PROT|nr:YdbH domain-containing protein [Niveispirillum lacus]OYQ34119.1 hypothetical protein CHU95_11695 [Niveispirillum lacus]